MRKSYEQFCDILPVFTLLGSEVMPPETIDIDDDPGLMLVCKYLKAYDDKNLDRRLYGKIIIIINLCCNNYLKQILLIRIDVTYL